MHKNEDLSIIIGLQFDIIHQTIFFFFRSSFIGDFTDAAYFNSFYAISDSVARNEQINSPVTPILPIFFR